jgi:16S rRNA (uracil1498-N3)-methyltransferase
MHRFYLPPDLCRGESLVLPEREARHAATVLRVRPGDEIVVLDGAGSTFHARAEEVSRKFLRASVLSRAQAPPLPCLITLAQAIPKGKLMEAIIQKATELGAARIVPLLSERVVSQFDEEDAAAKAARWQQVAVEAMKQCGTPWLPRVDLPVTPARFLALDEKSELALIGSLRGDARHPRQYFDAFREARGRPPSSACLWIGPEGDFTDAEIDAVRAAGALPITLGPLILRCETAATACLAILNYELAAGKSSAAAVK